MFLLPTSLHDTVTIVPDCSHVKLEPNTELHFTVNHIAPHHTHTTKHQTHNQQRESYQRVPSPKAQANGRKRRCYPPLTSRPSTVKSPLNQAKVPRRNLYYELTFITVADLKTAIAGWNFQLSDNEQNEDALRTAWRTMTLTIYYTDKGADTVSRQQFML
jgi:hypothetical protein